VQARLPAGMRHPFGDDTSCIMIRRVSLRAQAGVMHGDGGALRRNWSMCAAMRSVVCMVRATLGDVNATQ
jgi:hypothetical protein